MAKNLFIIWILAIFQIKANNENNVYKKVENWAKENGIYINEKMKMNFISENNKYYLANEDITEGEILLKVPKKLILSSLKVFEFSSKKMKEKYENLLNFYTEPKINSGANYNFSQNNQDLVLTMGTYLSLKKEKGQLYETYKDYFNTFEENIFDYPIFYTEKQQSLLANASYGNEIIRFKNETNNEINTITKLFNIYIDNDLYYKLRILIVKKSIYINNYVRGIIPLSDFFNLETNDYNCIYEISERNDEDFYVIKTTKKINKNDILNLRLLPSTLPNLYYIIYYNKYFKFNSQFISMKLPLIHPKFQSYFGQFYEIELDDEYLNSNYVELSDDKYYLKYFEYYSKFIDKLELKNNEHNKYKLILKSFEIFLEGYNCVDYPKIRKEYFYKSQIDNLIQIINEEKLLLSSKIKELQGLINREKDEDDKKFEDL